MAHLRSMDELVVEKFLQREYLKQRCGPVRCLGTDGDALHVSGEGGYQVAHWEGDRLQIDTPTPDEYGAEVLRLLKGLRRNTASREAAASTRRVGGTQHLMYRGAVYRLVEAARVVMYHGTSAGPDGALLRRLLKEGLIPDPKKKVYDVPEGDDWDYGDYDTSMLIQMDESYGGIYLTSQLSRAKVYADHASHERGGDRVLLAVQVEPRSPGTAIDEDLLFKSAFDFVDRWIGTETWYEADQMIENSRVDWKQLAQDYLTRHLGMRLHPGRIAAIVEPLGLALKGLYSYHLYKDHMEEIAAEYEAQEDDYFEEDPRMVEDALAEYREYGPIATQKLREAVQPSGPGLHNIRFTTPISYRGANKIVAVVSSSPEGGNPIVHYAADPQQAKKLAAALTSKRGYERP